MKKKIVTIVLSIVLFVSVAVLGVANVYRIDSVSLVSSTISTQAKREADDLEERLKEVYVGSNTLFVDSEPAEIVLESFPYFRVTAFKKQFPNQLIIEVKEDEEMFAVALNKNQTKFGILGADGVYLGDRITTQSRQGDYHNILVTLDDRLSFDGTLGARISGEAWENAFLEVVKAMSDAQSAAGNLRGNVVKIDVLVPSPSSNPLYRQTLLKITMREGIVGEILNFEVKSAEKAKVFIKAYEALPDREKATGSLTVFERNGVVEFFSKTTD